MEGALTGFIRALRSAGAMVSSAEAIDAARALALVGYGDRARMKDSLSVVLAKSAEEKALHDALFDAYFSVAHGQAHAESAARQAHAASQAQSGPSEADAPGGDGLGSSPQAADSLTGSPEGSPAGEPAMGMDPVAAFVELAQSDDPNRIAVAMARAGAAAGVDDIRFGHQATWYVSQMLKALGGEALEARLSERVLDPSPDAQADAQQLIDARAAMRRHARDYVDQRFELFGRSATERFMDDVVVNREIGQLGVRDMERMKALVARMARRLAVRHSRRRRVRQRGQLDLRRTLRANAGHDGVPFDLVLKRKRKDRPKIVAVCDVSGSVARYVRFLLLFLHALKEEVPEIDAFAFSAELRDVGHELGSLGFEQAMERILMQVGSGTTDYGQALADLEADHGSLIDRRTTVLMLGDGRSNRTDPRLDLFKGLAERAKRVVWLCPEPPALWGSGDSCMLQYQPFCTHLSHCVSAADLERALDDVLSAYD